MFERRSYSSLLFVPHPRPFSNMEKGARKNTDKSVFLLPSSSWRGAGGEVKTLKVKGVDPAIRNAAIIVFSEF